MPGLEEAFASFFMILFLLFFKIFAILVIVSFIIGALLGILKKAKECKNNKYLIAFIIGLIPIILLIISCFIIRLLVEPALFMLLLYFLIPCSIVGIIVSTYFALKIKKLPLDK